MSLTHYLDDTTSTTHEFAIEFAGIRWEVDVAWDCNGESTVDVNTSNAEWLEHWGRYAVDVLDADWAQAKQCLYALASLDREPRKGDAVLKPVADLVVAALGDAMRDHIDTELPRGMSL